jgi:hypothetical protein
MDHLIPLEHNSQPPDPHPFHILDDNELLTLVTTHISVMNTIFVWFDTITPAFIKGAYKRTT